MIGALFSGANRSIQAKYRHTFLGWYRYVSAYFFRVLSAYFLVVHFFPSERRGRTFYVFVCRPAVSFFGLWTLPVSPFHRRIAGILAISLTEGICEENQGIQIPGEPLA